MLMGATLRSLQIAGALEALLDISVRYSNERIAFEKRYRSFRRSSTTSQNWLVKSPLLLQQQAPRQTPLQTVRRSMTRCFSKRRPPRSAARKLRKKERQLPIRCMARSGFPWSTSCIVIRCARCRGATTSATKATGRRSSESLSRRAAPTICGRWSHLDKPA